jgi:hypothetical protein
MKRGPYKAGPRMVQKIAASKNEPCLSNPVIGRKYMKSTAHEQTIIYSWSSFELNAHAQ